MKHVLRKFRKDETGAIAVDWVALSAAIVGLAVGVVAVIGESTDVAANSVVTSMEDAGPE
jgi:Flp pilus assembly pilin Flp